MENLVSKSGFWFGKKVLITGHTGFKGGWLAHYLYQLGAEVYGLALPAIHAAGIYHAAQVSSVMKEEILTDICNEREVADFISRINPEIVFHLAAQALVLESYQDPITTIKTNIVGTAIILDVLRSCSALRAVIVITSDKCYKNNEWLWPYRELDPLGGYDPYSTSKACQELITASWYSSFFTEKNTVKFATARAGNVIGGGDWAENRLIPDAMRAMHAKRTMLVRSPKSIRPWQHVLDCLNGYMLLAELLTKSSTPDEMSAWNFGPNDSDTLTVQEMVEIISAQCQEQLCWELNSSTSSMPEASLLRLDSSKARGKLGWKSRWSAKKAIEYSVQWYMAQACGNDMKLFTVKQILAYETLK